jgi:hypothetical protein
MRRLLALVAAPLALRRAGWSSSAKRSSSSSSENASRFLFDAFDTLFLRAASSSVSSDATEIVCLFVYCRLRSRFPRVLELS